MKHHNRSHLLPSDKEARMMMRDKKVYDANEVLLRDKFRNDARSTFLGNNPAIAKARREGTSES